MFPSAIAFEIFQIWKHCPVIKNIYATRVEANRQIHKN